MHVHLLQVCFGGGLFGFEVGLTSETIRLASGQLGRNFNQSSSSFHLIKDSFFLLLHAQRRWTKWLCASRGWTESGWWEHYCLVSSSSVLALSWVLVWSWPEKALSALVLKSSLRSSHSRSNDETHSYDRNYCKAEWRT